ncbi:MAG TPA: serine hydrolase, partial [Mycobacteriales bacterium]|nr:serine hydrolase [Mycobacteriales bacterium]
MSPARPDLAAIHTAAERLPTTALTVISGGETILQYGDLSQVTYQASVRKSLLSLLFGRPVSDGHIRLDSTLEQLGIDDVEPLSAAERRATVADLLTARSGVYHPAANPGGDENAPPRGSRSPGTHFLYNNWDFNVLGTIFAQQTGRSVHEAAATELAGPLQFQDFDPARQRLLGRNDRSRHLAYHFFLSCRDLARIGQLVLQGGEWAGRPVVPADWLARSISPQVSLGALDYGYLWWVPKARTAAWAGSCLAIGKFGQYLLVLPALDLVVAHNRAVPDDFAVARNQGFGANDDAAPEGVSTAQFLGLV